MKNFIVSYDLNGPRPTHDQFDKHIKACPNCSQYGRILETVWFVQYDGTTKSLFGYLWQIMSPNDRLMVIEGKQALFQNLLINDADVIAAWNGRRAA